MSQKHYKITLDSKHLFNVTITTHKDRYTIIANTIISRHPAKCVYITVYRKVPMSERTVAHLEGLKHDEGCAQPSLERGKGTILMLRALMTFTWTKFPYITSFSFKDTSHIECKRKIEVPLSYLHFAKHNQTWYMQQFNARPEHASNHEQMKHVSSLLSSKTYKKAMGGPSHFVQLIERHFPKMRYVNLDAFLEGVRHAWQESDTLNQFFALLATNDCIFFQEWLREYFVGAHSLVLDMYTYIIDVKEDDMVRMMVEKIENPSKPQHAGAPRKTPTRMHLGRYHPDYF